MSGSTTGRACHVCGRAGGFGKRELRPYGPGGADVCAGCVFGENGGRPAAARVAEAERQLGARLLTSEPLVLDVRDQIGPVPSRPVGSA